MLTKSNLEPETRFRLLVALGPIACMAFILSILLGRMDNPNLDFLTGLLVGFSIVGNLTYIIVVTRKLHQIGGCHD